MSPALRPLDRHDSPAGHEFVEAEVIERSVTSNKWEASSAVMEALGVDAGFTSCTHSWGSVTGVTVTVR